MPGRDCGANEVVGFNTRLTDIGAAIGRVQLTRVPGWTKQRVANAAVLDDRLPSFGLDLDLPATEAAAAEVLSLPVRPDLTDDEIDTIVTAVNG